MASVIPNKCHKMKSMSLGEVTSSDHNGTTKEKTLYIFSTKDDTTKRFGIWVTDEA